MPGPAMKGPILINGFLQSEVRRSPVPCDSIGFFSHVVVNINQFIAITVFYVSNLECSLLFLAIYFQETYRLSIRFSILSTTHTSTRQFYSPDFLLAGNQTTSWPIFVQLYWKTIYSKLISNRTTTLGGPYSAQFYITKLRNQEDYKHLIDYEALPISDYQYILEGNKPQIQWSSASSPDATPVLFAVGANNQVSLIKNRQETWDITAIDCPDEDAFSVDFLSHKILISGHGSGKVKLWDLRDRGSATRFRFPRSINHARKLNENQVVVSGKTESVSPLDSISFQQNNPKHLTQPPQDPNLRPKIPRNTQPHRRHTTKNALPNIHRILLQPTQRLRRTQQPHRDRDPRFQVPNLWRG